MSNNDKTIRAPRADRPTVDQAYETDPACSPCLWG
jgi:hypothetical protein